MKKMLFVAAVLSLSTMCIPANFAFAQNAGSGTGRGTVTNSGNLAPPSQTGVPQAPIGHRQPRRGDVPDPQGRGPDAVSVEQDRVLDRKIKGICRGC